uniref:Chromo domain-containing protein n=1 Tax=Clastoptera arizonana TaxID=38151 RepID=A0A1B6D8N7_9HEMI
MSQTASKNVEKDQTSSTDEFLFKEGEKVLCYHGPLIYFAKCMQARQDSSNVVEYYIHYSGWNKSWDEWVPISRVLKINDENLQKQKDLNKAQKSEAGKKNKKKKSSSVLNSPDTSQNTSISTPGNNTSLTNADISTTQLNADGKASSQNASNLSQDLGELTPKRKKSRVSESSSSQDDQAPAKEKITHSFAMSPRIKLLLAQDWFNVDVNKQLVKLPCTHSIDTILEKYLQEQLEKNKNMRSSEKDLIKGIADYFNTLLNPSLLYLSERLQYDEIFKEDPNASVTKIYGVVHLLRLLVIFPEKLAAYPLVDKQRVEHMITKIQPLVEFVELNIDKFLCDVKYETASTDSQSKPTS